MSSKRGEDSRAALLGSRIRRTCTPHGSGCPVSAGPHTATGFGALSAEETRRPDGAGRGPDRAGRGSASRGWAGAAAVRLAFPPPRAHGAALNVSGFLLARGPGFGPRPAPRRCRQGVTAIRGSGARMDRGPVEGASWGRTGEAGEAIGHGGCRVCVWGGRPPAAGPAPPVAHPGTPARRGPDDLPFHQCDVHPAACPIRSNKRETGPRVDPGRGVTGARAHVEHQRFDYAPFQRNYSHDLFPGGKKIASR